MPAEWEPHAATWLAWPHKEASWPGLLDRIPPVMVAMIRALVEGEAVHVNVLDESMERAVRARLAAAGLAQAPVHLHRIPTDDAWARDHGPIWLVRDRGGRREQMILDWDYNAWGGKYPPFAQDDAVPVRVGELLGIPVRSPGMVLEGGSIDVNGAGTLLTTESCLLNPNRNPRLSRAEIEAALRDWLGVRQILWLGDGIAGDDTDGHVDDLTRFVAPGTVVTVLEENPRDPNFEPLRANLARLQAMRLEDGAPLRVVPLPMPDPVGYENQRLPASYANFYIANRVVLLPVFGCAQDERAQRTLAALFPGRAVVPIPARDLVWGLGACHCLTQQQPAAAAGVSRDAFPLQGRP